MLIGENEEYDQLLDIKKKLDSDLLAKWIQNSSNSASQGATSSLKREFDDITSELSEASSIRKEESDLELELLTDFILDVIEHVKIEGEDSKLIKNQASNIVRLCLAEDKTLHTIWRSLSILKSVEERMGKFIKLLNYQYEMVRASN